MAAIGLDILNIGSSKWSQDMDMSADMMASEGAPSHFMLPAVENVSQRAPNKRFLTLLIVNHIVCAIYSLLSFAGQISTRRREKITTRKLSS